MLVGQELAAVDLKALTPLTRRGDGAIVSVRLRGRPWAAVLADMIEGVVSSNQLLPPQSDRLRSELWAVCGVASVVEGDHSGAIARVA